MKILKIKIFTFLLETNPIDIKHGIIHSVNKDLIIIKKASHYFNDTEDMREKVFKISEDWFNKITK